MIEKRIEEFLKKHKITIRPLSARSYIFDCPSCGGKNKLYIEKKTGYSVCFKQEAERCPSPGSNAAYALGLVSGISYADVKKELYLEEIELSEKDEIRVNWDQDALKEEEIEPLKPCGLPLDMALITNPRAAEGLAYLSKRGISTQLALKHSVTYSPSMRRVIFPVIMDGVMYGWQGRAIDQVAKEDRMYNLPGRWKTATLMFYDNLKGKDWAVLAEGPISAIKFAEVGGYVASMGKNVSPKQLDLIKAAGVKKLFLALDRDAADKMVSIEKYLNKDGHSVQCFIVPVPTHRDDFGEATYEENLEAFMNAQDFDKDGIYVSIDASPKSIKKYMEKS
jgi:hypothetical protein